MESIDLVFDANRTRALYDKFVKYQRKRYFRKIPIGYLLIFFTGMILIGVMTRIDFIWILAVISISLISIFLLFFVIRFQIWITKFKKQTEENAQIVDKNFQFAFNTEKMVYTSENIVLEIKWNKIKNYDLNDGDLYLFLENQQLQDIISEKIIGREKFESFSEIVKEKIERVPNGK